MAQRTDILIIGGGAAGLAAAVFCARAAQKPGVTVLEKSARVGKKLLATGNGTCNLTNRGATADRYHGGDPAFIRTVLAAFSPEDAIRFFGSIGVECVTEPNGRVYPASRQAAAVLNCLRAECAALGVHEICDSAVIDLKRTDDGWRVRTEQDVWTAERVLVTTGGAASPALGGDAGGYALLTALGHERTPLFPAIVQIKTDPAAVRALKGIRVDGRVTVCLNGRPVATDVGEILFTEYGLSGPATLAVSRAAGDWERTDAARRGKMTVKLDLLPDTPDDEVLTKLHQRRTLSERSLEQWLTGWLNNRLGQTLLKAAGLAPLSRMESELTDGDLERLTAVIKGWTMPVTGTKGLANAQVTAGGLATADFSPQTLESRRAAGVYAAGEVLDVDGDCGGFNLQWAWASAFVAARAMTAEKI